MDTTTVKAFISFEAKDEDTLRSYLNHHLEYLIDFNDIDDICQSAGNVLLYAEDESDFSGKAGVLRSVATDILAGKPDEKNAKIFAQLSCLLDALEEAGY